MNKTELEEKIKNGESVWVVDKDLKRVIPYNANRIIVNNFNADALGYNFEDLYKTKAEAEHYLNHANITRTEQLPFLSWEEFLEKKSVNFVGKYGREYLLKKKYGRILLIWINVNNSIAGWDLTEENFYKAYDECVRLFRSEG